VAWAAAGGDHDTGGLRQTLQTWFGVARQDLARIGTIDNGMVAVTGLWADERCSMRRRASAGHADALRFVPAAAASSDGEDGEFP